MLKKTVNLCQGVGSGCGVRDIKIAVCRVTNLPVREVEKVWGVGGFKKCRVWEVSKSDRSAGCWKAEKIEGCGRVKNWWVQAGWKVEGALSVE